MNKAMKVIMSVILAFVLCLPFAACANDGRDGANGSQGPQGETGKSAYDIWLDNGHEGSEEDFLNWLKGQDGADGQDGMSAYDLFMKYNPDYPGNEEEWIWDTFTGGKMFSYDVTFMINPEPVVKTVYYGNPVEPPLAPEIEGNTWVWDEGINLNKITKDTVVTGKYVTDGLTWTWRPTPTLGDLKLIQKTNTVAESIWITNLGDEEIITIDCGGTGGIHSWKETKAEHLYIAEGFIYIGVPGDKGDGKSFSFFDLVDVSIPSTTEYIDKALFTNCENLDTIFYGGTGETSWQENITVGGWEEIELPDATWYYYSETEPTEEQLQSQITKGNYWHYAPDGCTPVIWE